MSNELLEGFSRGFSQGLGIEAAKAERKIREERLKAEKKARKKQFDETLNFEKKKFGIAQKVQTEQMKLKQHAEIGKLNMTLADLNSKQSDFDSFSNLSDKEKDEYIFMNEGKAPVNYKPSINLLSKYRDERQVAFGMKQPNKSMGKNKFDITSAEDSILGGNSGYLSASSQEEFNQGLSDQDKAEQTEQSFIKNSYELESPEDKTVNTELSNAENEINNKIKELQKDGIEVTPDLQQKIEANIVENKKSTIKSKLKKDTENIKQKISYYDSLKRKAEDKIVKGIKLNTLDKYVLKKENKVLTNKTYDAAKKLEEKLNQSRMPNINL